MRGKKLFILGMALTSVMAQELKLTGSYQFIDASSRFYTITNILRDSGKIEYAKLYEKVKIYPSEEERYYTADLKMEGVIGIDYNNPDEYYAQKIPSVYSNYIYNLQLNDFGGTFEEFIANPPKVVQNELKELEELGVKNLHVKMSVGTSFEEFMVEGWGVTMFPDYVNLTCGVEVVINSLNEIYKDEIARVDKVLASDKIKNNSDLAKRAKELREYLIQNQKKTLANEIQKEEIDSDVNLREEIGEKHFCIDEIPSVGENEWTSFDTQAENSLQLAIEKVSDLKREVNKQLELLESVAGVSAINN